MLLIYKIVQAFESEKYKHMRCASKLQAQAEGLVHARSQPRPHIIISMSVLSGARAFALLRVYKLTRISRFEGAYNINILFTLDTNL